MKSSCHRSFTQVGPILGCEVSAQVRFVAEKGAGRDWDRNGGRVGRSGGGARDRGESSACVGLFRDGQGSCREECQELF